MNGYFDLINHVTYGNYWMHSFLALLPVPFLWGPVGGGESSPKAFMPTFSLRGRVYERLRNLARRIGERDPFVQLTAKRACLALATTHETAGRLSKLGCRDVKILSQSALSGEEITRLGALPRHTSVPFRIVSIGRLLHWKGFHLGLKAFAQLQHKFPTSEYYLIGDGPELRNLESLAQQCGIAGQVRFWGSLPRQHVLEKLAECDVLLHPSLHDSGSSVCLEAMAAGCPVICLELGGPALEVTADTGLKLPALFPAQVISDLSRAMFRLAHDPKLRCNMGEAARKRVAEYFAWDHKGEWIDQVCQEIVSRSS